MTHDERKARIKTALQSAREAQLTDDETAEFVCTVSDSCDIDGIIADNEYDECRRIANMVQAGYMAEAVRAKRQSASEPLRRLIQMQCEEIKRLKKEAGK